MAPYRAQRQRQEADQRAKQRAADQQLLAELDQLASVRWVDPAGEALSAPVSHDAQPLGGITPADPLALGAEALGTDAVIITVGALRYQLRGASAAQVQAILAQAQPLPAQPLAFIRW
jgi:hypothetical protein